MITTKLTIYDIAKLADTSVSTVSRYLNNKPIKEENRLKIEKIMQNEGKDFTPNAMARALVSKTTKTVAIITVDIRTPHFASVAYNFEQMFTKKGYNVIICNTSLDEENLKRYITNLIKRSVDGIAFIGSIFGEINNMPEILEMIKKIPVVIANGTINLNNSYSVLIDDAYGVSLAGDYLLKKGRKNIYFLSDEKNDSGLRKMSGFKKFCSEHNIDYESHLFSVAQSIEGGEDGVREIISKDSNVDSIICGNDIVGVGVINYINHLGIKAGYDIDVISYNNTLYSEITNPKMTIINNKPDKQAFHLVELLERLINKEECDSIIIKPELVLKESA